MVYCLNKPWQVLLYELYLSFIIDMYTAWRNVIHCFHAILLQLHHNNKILLNKNILTIKQKMFLAGIIAHVWTWRFAAQGFFFSFRGEDFRGDFSGLSVLKTCFTNVPTVASTATAPPHLLRDLKQGLRLKNECEIVARNLSRVNIFLDKKVLTVSRFQLGNVWSRDVFRPIFINLDTFS